MWAKLLWEEEEEEEEEIDLTDGPASGHGRLTLNFWQPAKRQGCGGRALRDEGPNSGRATERIAHSMEKKNPWTSGPGATTSLSPTEAKFRPKVTTHSRSSLDPEVGQPCCSRAIAAQRHIGT
jgi:hypothetical protein